MHVLIKYQGNGVQVVLEETVDGTPKQVPLRIVGIGDQACLMACDDFGTMFELHPDGNRWAPVQCDLMLVQFQPARPDGPSDCQ